MGSGFVGTLTVDLHLPGARSLKDKRTELQRLKAGLTKLVACAIAEVDFHDLHRRARLSLAVVTRESGECERLLDSAARRLHDDPAFAVLSDARDVVAIDDTPQFLRGGQPVGG